MTASLNSALDPRLKRLVQTSDDPERLRIDLARGVVAAERTPAVQDLIAGAPLPAAESITIRVLVNLAPDVIPESFARLRWTKITDGVYAVRLPVAELEALAAQPQVKFIEAPRRLLPSLNTSLAETRANLVHHPAGGGPGLDGQGVVVGIIDYGLDYTLDDFRDATGATRVAFLWDQTLTRRTGERRPAGFTYGVEYTAADINAALALANPFTKVRHHPEAGSHGTHVAGIAAGNGRTKDSAFPIDTYVGAAPRSTIIFVQPAADDAATSFTDSVHVAEAIAYIYQRAQQLGRPCVINMSLGQNGGSHDGESVVERAIDRLLEAPGRAFVSAAGNEHTWRGHASGTLVQGQSRALRWRMGGQLPLPGGGALPAGMGDFTPNELEVWYSPRDRVDVRLVNPSGSATALVQPGETELHTMPGGERVFIDSERFTVMNGDARIYIEVSPGPGGTIGGGEWRVELTATERRDGRFDAWIERDARRRENNFADQSFFAGTDFDPVMTLGTPATTRRGIAVANYDHVTVAPSGSSSRGPTRTGGMKPEVAAPGTNIASANALAGRAAGGGMQPARVRMSGTSMSAPHVAGIVALLLQRRPELTAPQIRKILIASASPPPGVTVFDPAWGFGRVDAQAAVALL